MNWDWQKFYEKAYTWIITAGPKIILAIIVLIVGLWLIRLFNRGFRNTLDKKHFNPSLRYFLANLTAITLQILLLLLVLQVAGIQLTFLTAILAGLTVAAGLALSGTLQNFVSGILILLLRPFKVGDTINTQGQEGKVTSIQIFYTTVLTYDNKTITIPNGQLSNNVIINLSREGNRRIDIEMKFSYAIAYDHVKQVLTTSIDKMDDMLHDPPVRIGVHALEADKYTVMINIWTAATGFIDKKMLVQERLLKDLSGSGIKLPGM
jgi:small conductance mechanosensitive channel